MTGPETRLRKKIVKKLLEIWPRAYIRKIHGNAFQNVGIADLLCCIEGVFFALEVKMKGRHATPAQLLEGEKVKKASGYFAVVFSVDETVSFVQKTLKSLGRLK